MSCCKTVKSFPFFPIPFMCSVYLLQIRCSYIIPNYTSHLYSPIPIGSEEMKSILFFNSIRSTFTLFVKLLKINYKSKHKYNLLIYVEYSQANGKNMEYICMCKKKKNTIFLSFELEQTRT